MVYQPSDTLDRKCATAMTDIALVFPVFPAISGKKVTAAFDGGKITSDAGVLLLAQAEKQLGIAPRLAALFSDKHDPTRVQHLLPDILFAHYLAIAATVPAVRPKI